MSDDTKFTVVLITGFLFLLIFSYFVINHETKTRNEHEKELAKIYANRCDCINCVKGN